MDRKNSKKTSKHGIENYSFQPLFENRMSQLCSINRGNLYPLFGTKQLNKLLKFKKVFSAYSTLT